MTVLTLPVENYITFVHTYVEIHRNNIVYISYIISLLLYMRLS